MLKYLEEARPKLAGARDEGVLFLGDAGEGLHVDYLTQRVRQYVVAAVQPLTPSATGNCWM